MFKLFYNGLFGKKFMGTVNSKEEAIKMCFEHNKLLSDTEILSHTGTMHFEKDVIMDEGLENIWKQYLIEEGKSDGWTKKRTGNNETN